MYYVKTQSLNIRVNGSTPRIMMNIHKHSYTNIIATIFIWIFSCVRKLWLPFGLSDKIFNSPSSLAIGKYVLVHCLGSSTLVLQYDVWLLCCPMGLGHLLPVFELIPTGFYWEDSYCCQQHCFRSSRANRSERH